ncbi:MAG: hypothetical protein RLZZ480_501 [Candidatus Parcubacteria bacterium]|jgi:hypothetical protein
MRALLGSLLLLILPAFVSAQFDLSNLSDFTNLDNLSSSFIGSELSIESDPMVPQPGAEVTLSINDYGSDFYGANLQWYKNNEPIPDSLNSRSITITAPGVGSSDTISLVLTAGDGRTTTLKKIFAPVYADIIVEPETHVPGFYKGRALPSPGSKVNLTVLLNNGSMMGNNFIYTWRVNEEVLEAGPIRNRNQISFITPQDSEFIVSVQVTAPNGDIVANRSISISSVMPSLYYYEVNALYGVEQKPISDTFYMIANSTTFRAEPYYLSSTVFNNPEIFEWTLNGQLSQNPSNDPYELTLEKTGSTKHTEVDLHIRSTTDLLQGARGGFTLVP